jgi:DNA-binding NtrC family response regulator
MGPYTIVWICDPASTPAAITDHPPGWDIRFLHPDDAFSVLSRGGCLTAVLDCPIAGWATTDLLEETLRAGARIPTLIRDPDLSVAGAARLAHMGAHQVLSTGDDPFAAIEEMIAEENRRNAVRLSVHMDTGWESTLVGNSREIRQIAHIIRLVGGRRATVLITGETGTGKEVAARALHQAGNRRSGPMVAVNCGALPESLLESELFGHVRGAFTGAWQNRVGRFEQASGGTIFLDEIAELPMELQAKLLRVLQERELQRLGSSETIKVDVRVVAATNCDLADRIERGKFREDLYYRLNVVPLRMPALRERPGDIPVLAAHFLEKICKSEHLPLKRLTLEGEERLCRYSWPGNVRQLENAIETAIALSGDRLVLAPADFPVLTADRPRPAAVVSPIVSVPDGGLDYERTLAGIEKSILEQALRITGGNKKAAADMLRLKRTTLSAKVRTLAAVG